MAKFNLASSTNFALTFGGTTLSCVQTIDVNGNAPVQEIECAGATSVEQIVGITRTIMTVTGALEDNDTTLLGAIDPGDTGAIVCDPAGTATGTIDISSTNATVGDRTISLPVNGFATYSVTLLLDDITIAANA